MSFKTKKDGSLLQHIMKSKFHCFVHNVYCRRENNQHKAHKLWDEIKEMIPDNIRGLFETEWSHYCMGEFNPDEFGIEIDKLKPYFKD